MLHQGDMPPPCHLAHLVALHRILEMINQSPNQLNIPSDSLNKEEITTFAEHCYRKGSAEKSSAFRRHYE
jgi:hypothetical protein